MSDTFLRTRTILVIGDWVIDDNWLIGTHRSQTAANSGFAHYRSLNLPDNVVRRLSGAGYVASLLHAASGGPTPDALGGFNILGIGLWDPEDKDYLRGMFNPDCMVGRTPYRVTSDELKKDQLPSQVELVSIEGLFDKSRVRTVKQAEGSRTDPPLRTAGPSRQRLQRTAIGRGTSGRIACFGPTSRKGRSRFSCPGSTGS